MAIPSSGQLALSTIRDEFGAGTTSNVSLRTLSAAAGLSTPDGFNEFYGLSAFSPPSYISGANSISGSGTQSSPYVFTRTSFTAGSYSYDYVCDELYEGSPYSREFFRTENSGYIRFQIQENILQKAYITFTTLNHTNFCSAYNAVYFTPGQYMRNSSNKSSIFLSASGSTTSLTNLKNSQQNEPWTLYANQAGNYLDYYLEGTSYQKYQDWLPGNCEPSGAPWTDSTFGCSTTAPDISNWTVSVWFEPA